MPQRTCIPACALLAAAALANAGGCQQHDRVPTYAAGGVVRFADGAALSGGSVLCVSDEQGLQARGVINADGSFRLGTYDSDDGATAGGHRVAIWPPQPAGIDPDSAGGSPAVIDPRFTTFDASGLSIEVDPSGDNQFELVVAPPGG